MTFVYILCSPQYVVSWTQRQTDRLNTAQINMKLLRMKQQRLKLLKLLLLLQVLGLASADDFHKAVYITACSDSDKEDMHGMDGEVMFYADFDQKKMVYTMQQFGNPIECLACYEAAVGNLDVCKHNLQNIRKHVKDPPRLDPPGKPLLFPNNHTDLLGNYTLLCQASGFYPAPVIFSWSRDGLPVNSSSVSQAYPQSDGSFSQMSTLEVHPKDGKEFNCSLEHPGLRGEKRISQWKVPFQRPSQMPSVLCGVGLTVAVVGAAFGTFFLIKGLTCQRSAAVSGS